MATWSDIDWNKKFIRVEPLISVMTWFGVVGLKSKVRSTKSKNQDVPPCVFFLDITRTMVRN